MKTNKKFRVGAIVLLAMSFQFFAAAQIQNAEEWRFPGANQQNYRYHINIPDIDGYETLKCDLHIHTVFSDGQEWPTMRVNEAWNDGLDAIAITDHIEVRRNKDLLIADFNKSNEIAIKRGNEIGLLVIPGSEITRKKPFGHMNALFIQDANKLETANEMDALNEAFRQGAFLVWNHPGYPNDTSTLYPLQQELIKQKKLNGVEVFNNEEMYPEVMGWCKEFNLTWLANTDIHYTSGQLYREKMERALTLVFVKERSLDGIKEALFDGRTLACFQNCLAGKEQYIREIIQKSLKIKVIDAKKSTIEICNTSDITFQIKYGKFMYSTPLYANQVFRAVIPSGSDVTFTNCYTGQDEHVVMKLW